MCYVIAFQSKKQSGPRILHARLTRNALYSSIIDVLICAIKKIIISLRDAQLKNADPKIVEYDVKLEKS